MTVRTQPSWSWVPMTGCPLLASGYTFWNPRVVMVNISYRTSSGSKTSSLTFHIPNVNLDASVILSVIFYLDRILNLVILDLPVAEVFAFAINTLLSDMAVVDGGFRTIILEAQMSLLEKCVQAIEKAKESVEDPIWYCDSLIPVTFGLCRALGRFGLPDNFLITRVFPQEAPPPSPASQLITAKQSFSNFR